MERLRSDDLEHLTAERDGPCVSILLPTQPAGHEVAKKGAIRLKNLLREARAGLVDAGLRGTEADDLLAPATARVEDSGFWARQGHGLALYLAPGHERVYRLPRRVEERVRVGERFHLRSVLPQVEDGARFYVLALSENDVRLLEGTRHDVQEVHPDGLPADLRSALWADDPEKSLQHHSGGAFRGRTRRHAMFHGHGEGKDVRRNRLERFFREVDGPLTKFLGGTRVPLVLAGVASHFPVYREVSDHAPIVEGGVEGNPDELSAEVLHSRAWPLVEPGFSRVAQQDRDRLHALLGTGTASTRVDDVVTAATQGRVECLFVAAETDVWGVVEGMPATDAAVHDVPRPGDLELLDVAANCTLATGGRVHVVSADEVPGGGPAAAVYRY